MKRLLFIFFFLVLLFPSLAQQDSLSNVNDSIAKVKEDRKKTYSAPRKASIMSAILPGLGQAYNKKFLKIPLIYAGLGGLGYMFVVNNDQYNYFRKNLIAENDNDPTTINTTRWDSDRLQIQKITYRKRRDIAAIGIALLYVLNIVDANVDAHLKTFDVSDDLSIQLDPWQGIYVNRSGLGTAMGFSVKFNFK